MGVPRQSSSVRDAAVLLASSLVFSPWVFAFRQRPLPAARDASRLTEVGNRHLALGRNKVHWDLALAAYRQAVRVSPLSSACRLRLARAILSRRPAGRARRFEDAAEAVALARQSMALGGGGRFLMVESYCRLSTVAPDRRQALRWLDIAEAEVETASRRVDRRSFKVLSALRYRIAELRRRIDARSAGGPR